MLILKVKANAKENIIHGFVETNGEWTLKVSVHAIPENGKANKAIIKMLAKQWDLNQNQLEIIKGTNSSTKLLKIRDIELEYLKKHLKIKKPS